MKIDWKKKLTSRKWWMAMTVLVAGLIQMFGGSEEIINQITGTVMSAAAVIAYTIGEGLADGVNFVEVKKEDDVNEL